MIKDSESTRPWLSLLDINNKTEDFQSKSHALDLIMRWNTAEASLRVFNLAPDSIANIRKYKQKILHQLLQEGYSVLISPLKMRRESKFAPLVWLLNKKGGI